MSHLTDEEQLIVETLSAASRQFNELPVEHSADKTDFDASIRSAQNVVLARAGVRSLRTEGGKWITTG